MPALLATLSWIVCSAVLPCLTRWTCTPCLFSVFLQRGDLLVRFVDEVGQVVRERPHLVGDRVGDEEADPGERARRMRRYTASTARPRGKWRALEERDGRIEDQRDEPATMNSTSTLPGRLRQRPQREQRERQHHELDPARDDGARRLGVRASARGPARRPASALRASAARLLRAALGSRFPSPRSLASHHRQSMAEPEARRPARGASILFVGDVVGGIGRRTLLD